MLSIGTNSSSKDKNWMIMYDQDSVDVTYPLSVSVNKNTGTSFLFSTNQQNKVFSMIKTGKDGNQISAHHDYTLRYGWAGDMCIDSNDNVYHSQLRSVTINGTPQTGQHEGACERCSEPWWPVRSGPVWCQPGHLHGLRPHPSQPYHPHAGLSRPCSVRGLRGPLTALCREGR